MSSPSRSHGTFLARRRLRLFSRVRHQSDETLSAVSFVVRRQSSEVGQRLAEQPLRPLAAKLLPVTDYSMQSRLPPISPSHVERTVREFVQRTGCTTFSQTRSISVGKRFAQRSRFSYETKAICWDRLRCGAVTCNVVVWQREQSDHPPQYGCRPIVNDFVHKDCDPFRSGCPTCARRRSSNRPTSSRTRSHRATTH